MSAEARLWPNLPRDARLMTYFIMQPWHLLLAILAGVVHEYQQQVIEYIHPRSR